MSELDEYLDFAKELALEAGGIMLSYFDAEEKGIELKEDQTPVTLADTEINSLVIAKVKAKFPDHGVLGEEESFNLEKNKLWIVDPLDGTPNFARGVPVAVFSIAFVVGGQPKVGVIYDPFTQRLTWATEHGVAFENNKKIDLANHKRSGSLVISSWVVGGINGSTFETAEIDGKLAAAYGKKGGIVAFDLPIAHALALVGAGRFDACITSVINPWDLAAGALICQEAGATVTDLFGDPVSDWSKSIKGALVAAPDIHKELSEVIQPVLKEFK